MDTGVLHNTDGEKNTRDIMQKPTSVQGLMLCSKREEKGSNIMQKDDQSDKQTVPYEEFLGSLELVPKRAVAKKGKSTVPALRQSGWIAVKKSPIMPKYSEIASDKLDKEKYCGVRYIDHKLHRKK